MRYQPLPLLGACTVLSLFIQTARGQASQALPDPPSTPSTAPTVAPAVQTDPAYTPVRWNEDWSYLRTRPDTDLFDPIKFIPLSDDRSVYLSLGGQARYRYEWFDNASFGAGPQDDTGFHLLRLMAHADLHAGEHLRFFIQGISANADGREGGERPGIDENDLDIHQAFLDVHLPQGEDDRLTLRAGRQNLLYGAQRLISPLDWTNTRRTFDAVKLSRSHGGSGGSLDLFWARPVIVDEGPLDEWYEDAADFLGIYNTAVWARPGGGGTGTPTRFEQYLLYLDRDIAPFFQGTGQEERVTLGARFYTNPAPFDVDIEGAWQVGNFDSPAGEGDISAFFIAGESGYTLSEALFTPRLFAGGTWSSGDDDPTNADLGTFNQLYPLAHAYLGYTDLLGRQNAIDLYAGTELNLLADRHYVKKLSIQGTFHAFWRASDDDAIYTVAGAVGRAGGDERYIGSEIDLLLNWQIERHLSTAIGFSHVIAGDFIEETGPSDDISYLYGIVQFTF